MTWMTWLAFASGAAIGAPLRFLLDDLVEVRHDAARPYGTLVVNALGSLILGAVAALALRGRITSDVETVIGVGFTGALTTFSTFAVETVRLVEAGAMEEAVKNVALHASVSIGLAAVGYVGVLTVT